ncbi:hypothetical protein [Kingella negevensis]|nr:hypothetical protein [Kingella negevensis]
MLMNMASLKIRTLFASIKNETQETSTCDFGQRGRIEYALSLDVA